LWSRITEGRKEVGARLRARSAVSIPSNTCLGGPSTNVFVSGIYLCPGCKQQFELAAAAASGLVCRRCGARLKLGTAEGPPVPEAMTTDRGGNGRTPSEADGGKAARCSEPDHVRFESIGKEGNPQDVIAFSVMPVRGVPREVAAIEQLINAVGAAAGPISLDIAADEGRRFLIVRCRRKAAEFVQAQITSIYGSPIFERLDPRDDPAIRMERGRELVATGRMRLRLAPHLPLLTWRELQENDPVLGLMGAAGSVREGELALSQVLIHGRAPEGWARPYLRELLQLKRHGFGIVRTADVMRLLALVAGLAGLSYIILAGTVTGAWFSIGRLAALAVSVLLLYAGGPLIAISGHGAEWDESIEALVETKIQRPAYRCEVRLAASASTRDRAVQLLEQMAAAYNLFSQDSGNQLELLAPARSPQFTPASLAAYDPAVSLLNAAEIAGMWHMPLTELPDLLSASRVQVALPVPNQVLDPAGLLIGEARKSSGVRVPVYLPPDALARHMLLVGRTRMGKTTLAQHVACWAMRQPGRALVIVDPHRDMVEELLGHVPPERVGDVVLIDLADEEFIPGFNVLDVQQVGDPEKVVEAFVDVSYILWAGYWGPRMVVPLRMLLLALALANTRRAPEQQFTILALAPLIALTRERRSHFLREILPLDDPQSHNVIAYFETEYDDLTPSFQERVVSPVLSKARAFEFNSRIRAMVGQPASTINPWRFVADGKIVLFHTARPTVGDEFASFMGSMVLNYVRRAILAQGAVAVEERVPATVIVDESQTMAAVDYASIMAEAQKFGGSILLSTQGLSLLETSMQRENLVRGALDRQLLANSDTLIAFRVAGDDGARISMREFGDEVPATTLTNLPQYTAYVRTVVGREVVAPFAVETRPMAKGDAAIRARVLAARAQYALPFDQATVAAQRAMNVILRHFGTEIAAATAIHDGAFGDLLETELEFPPLEGNSPESDTGSMESSLPEDSASRKRSGHSPEGKSVAASEAPDSPPPSPGRQTPRDRMLDMLDRVAGWMEDGLDARKSGKSGTRESDADQA
jgi:hypothetical protein